MQITYGVSRLLQNFCTKVTKRGRVAGRNVVRVLTPDFYTLNSVSIYLLIFLSLRFFVSGGWNYGSIPGWHFWSTEIWNSHFQESCRFCLCVGVGVFGGHRPKTWRMRHKKKCWFLGDCSVRIIMSVMAIKSLSLFHFRAARTHDSRCF